MYAALKSRGLFTWIDEDQPFKEMNKEIVDGIDHRVNVDLCNRELCEEGEWLECIVRESLNTDLKSLEGKRSLQRR